MTENKVVSCPPCYAIAPGWTETPMVAANSQQNPGFAALAQNAIPAKRGGKPEEIAAAAIWLASDAASYVTRTHADRRRRHDDRWF